MSFEVRAPKGQARSSTIAQRRRLLVAGGWLSLLAATLHVDLRQGAAAEAWLATAEQMAEDAGDDEIRAWIHETRAWGMLTAGRYREALELSQRAQAIAPAGSAAQVLRDRDGRRPPARHAGRVEGGLSDVGPGVPGHPHRHEAVANVTVTVSPPPSRGTADQRAPWASTIASTMARPRPEPSWLPVRLPPRWNAWCSFGGSTSVTRGPVLATTRVADGPATVVPTVLRPEIRA
ncbi:hypothetical protein [Dactylosporangium sucinum]|uniref:hypothetical protein n=1 Tax=Dactylosporangium sucinum TaxID=1424081 RepID=UPI00402B69A7